MAEVSLIGTITGVARAGVKLSITLYSFSETVAATPAEVKNLARDVSLTAAVLEELGANLKQDDDQARLFSDAAVQKANNVVAECEGVFRDIDAMVARAIESASKDGLKGDGGKLAPSTLDRLKWPFPQPKMEVLHGNLDRLKSTFVLMLNVLMYARDLRAEKKTPSKDDNGNDSYQRTLLENLFRANEEATRNYQHLLKAVGAQDETVLRGQAQTEHSDPVTAQPLAGGETSPVEAPSIAAAKDISSGQTVARPNSEVLPPQQPGMLGLTTRNCLKRIESALLQFEQAGAAETHGSRVRVDIEVEKDFVYSRDTVRIPTPWVVLSIVRKDQAWPEHDATPSNLDSDDLDMYASVAAGAIESIGMEEETTTFVQHPPYRHRKVVSTLPVSENTQALDLSVGVQRRPSRKPWYSSVWESLPSPTAAMGSIQETVKNSGLFFGVEEESENPDNVLEYNKPGDGDAGASQPAESGGPKFARAPTFDDILKPPSSRSTLPVGSDINLESTHNSDTRPPPPEAAAKEEPAEQDLPSAQATVTRTDESLKEAAGSSAENAVAKEELADQGESNAIDQLLRQWTTLYDDQ
ncbi:uncharacterized protein Z520_08291 [Fonsecaea multimorphosa CBS 102226]|uniref:Fungal N-terminal domain-containing protein n=1 Tax=Fonsecaea multimorphosa CBS 102226 TaxID=1442371 RepID=A0A0D2IG49_9EURO|nr:uncharacterized protein Z520_08291 [Fonsecaea multimorphosa CBS 102226]KIX96036.1 hypothetical protein Z520_08291 [Fonsecaea multimorphosa CBS 102226]OAL21804.1 hypothetical protein AYO22_07746 [Fonsecaea multimorphosa]